MTCVEQVTQCGWDPCQPQPHGMGSTFPVDVTSDAKGIAHGTLLQSRGAEDYYPFYSAGEEQSSSVLKIKANMW